MKDDFATERLTIDLEEFVERHTIMPLDTDGFRRLQRAYDHLRDCNLGEKFIDMTRGEERSRFVDPKYFDFRPMCYLVGVTDLGDKAVVENRNGCNLFEISRIWLPYKTSEIALLHDDDQPIGIYLGTDTPETRYRMIRRVILSLDYACSYNNKIWTDRKIKIAC